VTSQDQSLSGRIRYTNSHAKLSTRQRTGAT
jgi:hypothetical protein